MSDDTVVKDAVVKSLEGGGNPCPDYALKGNEMVPQVEPRASFWFRCPILRTVSFAEVMDKSSGIQLPPYPRCDLPEAIAELDDLERRAANRQNPGALEELSSFFTDPQFTSQPPVGAVLNSRPGRLPLIKNGEELARLFEAETPGLWHRHVLNVLMNPNTPAGKRLSPPLQALIWTALDTAISSALLAAWHFKWLATDQDGVARRARPVEARPGLDVLFDYEVDRDATGNLIKGGKRNLIDHQGTPRHPAYPSGHSTFSAAASTVMTCFFPSYARDWGLLADNIGLARLWGGVHWKTDHTEGQRLGRFIGELVLKQLNDAGLILHKVVDVPTQEDLEAEAVQFAGNCDNDGTDLCGQIQEAIAGKRGFQNLA